MSCVRCHTHTDLLGKPYCIIWLTILFLSTLMASPTVSFGLTTPFLTTLSASPTVSFGLTILPPTTFLASLTVSFGSTISFLSACICISHAYTPRAFDPHRFSRIHLSSAAYFSFSRIGARDFPSVFFVCDLHASLYATHEQSKTEFKHMNSMNAKFSEPSDQYITASSEILFTSRAFSGRLYAFPDRPFSMFRSP